MSSSAAEQSTLLRLLKACAWGCAAGTAAAFGLAIPLAVLNLYLSGHGMTWQEKVHVLGWLQFSWLDLALFCGSVATALIVAYRNYRRETAEK